MIRHREKLKGKYTFSYMHTLNLSPVQFLFEMKPFHGRLVISGREYASGNLYRQDGAIHRFDLNTTEMTLSVEKIAEGIGCYIYFPMGAGDDSDWLAVGEALDHQRCSINKLDIASASIVPFIDRSFGNNLRFQMTPQSLVLSDFLNSPYIFAYDLEGNEVNKLNFIEYGFGFPLEVGAWDEDHVLIAFGNEKNFKMKRQLDPAFDLGIEKFNASDLALYHIPSNELLPLEVDMSVYPRSLSRSGDTLFVSNFEGDLIKYRIEKTRLETVFRTNIHRHLPEPLIQQGDPKIRSLVFKDHLLVYPVGIGNTIFVFRIV